MLANPNYHQPTDFLETMNHRQIMETAKVTAATLVYLASSPSRLKNLKVTKTAPGVEVDLGAEPRVRRQELRRRLRSGRPIRSQRAVTVNAARATLPAVPAGTQVAVKAVNARGLEGWDWARAVP